MAHMRLNLLKTALSTNLTLKFSSLIMGYCLWSLANQFHTIDLRYPIPLYFYGPVQKIVECPETITVTLRGRRSAFAFIESHLGIHIDTESLQKGTNLINLDDHHLFLPSSIKLVHWEPLPVRIIVDKK